MRKVIMSVDLEYDYDTKDRTESLKYVVPKLLDFFDEKNITATFFVVGNLVNQNKSLLKKIAKKHELASHTYSHANLKKLNADEIKDELIKSKKAIESLGVKCLGFRAPFGMIPPNFGTILRKVGYTYDSSILGSWFPGRYHNLCVQQEPYLADKNALTKSGKDILELPLSNFLLNIPFCLSSVRLFYPCSVYFLPKRPFNFSLHPYEFLESKPGKEIPFHLRGLMSINRGKKAWKVFKKLIDRMKDIEWVSCRDYLSKELPHNL